MYINFYNKYLCFDYECITLFTTLFIEHMHVEQRIAFFDIVRLVCVFKFKVSCIINDCSSFFNFEKLGLTSCDIINFCVSFFCLVISNPRIRSFLANTSADQSSLLRSANSTYSDVVCNMFDKHKTSDIC